MTYAATEGSRDDGSPIYLYLFQVGPRVEDIYAYTDAPDDLTVDVGNGFGPITYAAVPIDHNRRRTSGTMKVTPTTVEMDEELDLVQLLVTDTPSTNITLTIYGGHASDPDLEFVRALTARVGSFKRKNGLAALSAVPAVTDLRQVGPRRKYSLGCTHTLYSPTSCRADIVAASVTAEVRDTGLLLPEYTQVLQLAPGWTRGKARDGFAASGRVEWHNAAGRITVRTIRSIDGDDLTLNAPFRTPEPGTIVVVRLGCNLTQGHCANLHVETGTGASNIVNFGGQPFIPTENPFSATPLYY